jgi:hypothetical protein
MALSAAGRQAMAPAGIAQRNAQMAELDERLTDLEESLDAVEKKSILDRVQLGADYRLVFNAFHYRGPSPNPYDRDPTDPTALRRIDETSAEIWSHRLRIPIYAEAHKNLRLTARLVMFKNFGDSDQAAFIQDYQTTRLPRDSGIRFEQAWLDWFVTDWLTFSLGRLSYTDVNPPVELKENTNVRNPTWGLHIVDGEYETINVTFNLSPLVEQLYVRGFYASWFNDNDDPMGQFPFLSSGVDNLRIAGWNIDLRLPGLGRSYLQVGHYVVPEFRPFVIPISDPTFDPSADHTHAPAPLNGSLLYPSRLPQSLGSYHNLNALLELLEMGGSGLDVFAGFTIGLLSPNGKAIEYELPSDPADPMSAKQSTPFLYLASHGDDGTSFSLFTGLRMTLPIFSEKMRPKVGFEFNYGSRHHISFTMPNDQLVNRLATRGHAFESYVIIPIYADHLFLRFGYVRIENEYQQGFFGPNPALFGSTAPEVNQTIQSFNAILNARM